LLETKPAQMHGVWGVTKRISSNVLKEA